MRGSLGELISIDKTCTPSPGSLRNPTSPRKRGEVQETPVNPSLILFAKMAALAAAVSRGLAAGVVISAVWSASVA